MDNKIITLDDVELCHETDDAILISDSEGARAWLPKSKCEYDDSDNTLQLPEWLALDKGLI